MEDPNYEKFQATVSEYLIRHRSILDVISKFQESAARVNRAIVKSVTSCGCVQIEASRQTIPAGVSSYGELKNFMHSHLEGQLCDSCQEFVETELGSTLFYVAAICDLLGLKMEDILQKEHARISALGVYHLS
ncbi:MAG: DUF1573 domain-containing protein [Firmicutes bacterium]|nr:DUF1573 domain-containing protein [Bacillota bacterium]